MPLRQIRVQIRANGLGSAISIVVVVAVPARLGGRVRVFEPAITAHVLRFLSPIALNALPRHPPLERLQLARQVVHDQVTSDAGDWL